MTQISLDELYEARDKAKEKLDEAKSAYETEATKLNKLIRSLNARIWELAPHTMESVVEEFIDIRDNRGVIKEAYEAEDNYLKAQLEIRDAWILQQLNSIGAESMRTIHGTAYRQLKTRSNCNDWPTYWEYIRETGRFDLLEKRVSQKPISDMLKAGEELPPGISTHTEQTITVRRS